jgi:hypothetical protein
MSFSVSFRMTRSSVCDVGPIGFAVLRSALLGFCLELLELDDCESGETGDRFSCGM